MRQPISYWEYFWQEDCYFALIDGALFQAEADGHARMEPAFWRVKWRQLPKGRAKRYRRIAAYLRDNPYRPPLGPKPKINRKWYPYEEHGSYYQLRKGVLRQCPMNADGMREQNPNQVDDVAEEDEARIHEIEEELRNLP